MAWDEVADMLRADGHDVTALTLPGLESADANRATITLSDHVDAICDTVTVSGTPVVLAVHSGAGASGYAASDRAPEQIAAMVYMKEGYAWLGGFAELRDVTWIDLPTSHWPMWSRPGELAGIVGDVATAHSPGA